MNIKNLKEPFVLVLIGPPLSGKSTWIRNNFPDVNVISRDEIVMEVYGSRNYSEAFKNINQRNVDRVLKERLVGADKEIKNTIIDMTNMGSKRRRVTLDYFSDDYYKVGVIFPILDDEEYKRRNTKRIEEENKDLPMHIVKMMISQYQPIRDEEGFDKIISL